MSITATKGKNNGGGVKKIGLQEVKVIAINPTAEELQKMLGMDEPLEKEIEYVTEDKEGNTQVTISIWVESVIDGTKNSVRFYIKDKAKVSQAGKPQYINNVGTTCYSESKNLLPNWFTHYLNKEKEVIGEKNFREAYDGEENLTAFIDNWLNKRDYKTTEDIRPEYKKLFRGNVKELKDLIGSDLEGNIIISLEVKNKEGDDGEIKSYQVVNNRCFLPGYKMKLIRAAGIESSDDYNIKKFVKDLSGEFGTKNSYYLGEAKEYNAEEDVTASNNAIASDDASY